MSQGYRRQANPVGPGGGKVGPARGLAVAIVVFTAVLLVVTTTMRQMWSFSWQLFIDFSPMALLLVVSSAAVVLRPKNVSAWALFGISFTSVLENFGYAYGLYPTGMSAGHLPLALQMVLMALALQSAKWVFIPLLFLAFPSGSLDRKRWPATLIAVAMPVFVTLLVVFNPDAPYGPLEVAWRTAAREHGLLETLRVGWMVFQGAMVVLIIWTFAHAKTSSMVVRQQAKWLALGLVPLLTLEAYVAVFDPDTSTFMFFLFATAIRLIATVAVAISVTKYRLFDIDRVISRTILYGSMAVFIGIAYALIVGLATIVADRSVPSQSISMVAAVVAALLLLPLQSRLRYLANALVFGRRATPYQSMSEFSRVLGRSLNAEQVLPAVVDAVARGTGASWVAAMVRTGHGDRMETSGTAPSGGATSVDVRVGDEIVGRIEVAKEDGEMFTSTEIDLLEDLAAQAGPAFRSVALTLELEGRLDEITRQATELRRSRERIVAAQDDERRRIERDLHDGVQQNLVSLAGQLRLLIRMLDTQPVEAKKLAGRLAEEAMETLAEIRDLARGIFPQVLADAGLVAALRSHLSKVRGQVDIVVDQQVEGVRFDPAVEIAVYFCCLEALQNVAKHAAGAPAVVTLSAQNDQLTFDVADQGPGFDLDEVSPGVGLASMEDRVAALGGVLSVSASEGRGTVISGRIPILSAVADPRPPTIV